MRQALSEMAKTDTTLAAKLAKLAKLGEVQGGTVPVSNYMDAQYFIEVLPFPYFWSQSDWSHQSGEDGLFFTPKLMGVYRAASMATCG
jgi:hypothetical protein